MEFGDIVKAAADQYGDELGSNQIVDIFNKEYVNYKGKYAIKKLKFSEESEEASAATHTKFVGEVLVDGQPFAISGTGNGPIDSFFNALRQVGVEGYEFINYHEHAISSGSDSKAISYIELKVPQDGHIFGVGIDANINRASLLGVINAINRSLR